MTPGTILREARRRHGVSQSRLATRAGTTQSAISRIEGDKISPSIETLRGLLHMLGEDLVLGSQPRDAGIDRTLNRGSRSFDPDARVQRGLEFADFVRENRGGGGAAKA